MSTTQTNIELNNNRMNEINKTVEHIFSYILLYSVIIFTILSTILGGVIACPIYAAIYIFNKVKSNMQTSDIHKLEACLESETNLDSDSKKPIIDKNWCNINVKNIINYQRKSQEEEQSEEEEEQSEEILSLKIPEYTCSSKSESEEDNSQNDKYSLHYNQPHVDLLEK